MPKKWHGRLEDIASTEVAEIAYRTVKRNSENKNSRGLRFYSKEENRKKLCERLLAGEWRPHPPLEFDRVERGKIRHIRAPHPETKIVENMVILIYQTDICKYLHPMQCGSMPNKGLKYLQRGIRKWSRLPKKQKKYYVQWDVRHYFESVSKEDAMLQWRRHIGDTRVISLIEILHEANPSCDEKGNYMLMDLYGLDLGKTTAQYSANLNLTPAMYEARKHCGKVANLMDNFVSITGNKRKAKKFSFYIVDWFEKNRGLTVKTKGPEAIQVWHWEKRAIDIGGIKTSFKGVQKVRRHVTHDIDDLMMNETLSLHQARSFLSREGRVKHTDCPRYYQKLDKFEREHGLKHIVSVADRRRNNESNKELAG